MIRRILRWAWNAYTEAHSTIIHLGPAGTYIHPDRHLTPPNLPTTSHPTGPDANQ